MMLGLGLGPRPQIPGLGLGGCGHGLGLDMCGLVNITAGLTSQQTGSEMTRFDVSLTGTPDLGLRDVGR